MNIEAQVIGVPTGRPGLSAGDVRRRLGHRTGRDRRPPGRRCRSTPRELERRIVLAYTGASRQSGINNWKVMTRRIDGDAMSSRRLTAFATPAAGVRHALERQQWKDLATHLSAEWEHRKRLAPSVTTPEIDAMLAAGARGRRAGRQGLRRRRRRVSVLPGRTRPADRRGRRARPPRRRRAAHHASRRRD